MDDAYFESGELEQASAQAAAALRKSRSERTEHLEGLLGGSAIRTVNDALRMLSDRTKIGLVNLGDSETLGAIEEFQGLSIVAVYDDGLALKKEEEALGKSMTVHHYFLYDSVKKDLFVLDDIKVPWETKA
jgi:hypothetical protein